MSFAIEVFGDQIHRYSRAEAIDDGFLADVTETAKEAGFRLPVAVTNTVWEKYIEWTDADSKRQTYQDTAGRLWDVLWMAYLACRSRKGTDCLYYQLYVVPRGGRARMPRKTMLKITIGGGDNGEPVITIMLPNED